MASLLNDPIVGSDTIQGRVQSLIKASEVSTVVADQAGNYERLTNVASDGSGGAPSVAGHAHPGELFWPVSTQQWGDEGWLNHINAAFVGFDYANQPATIYSGADIGAGVSLASELFQYYPVFVASGWEGRTHLLVLSCRGVTPGIEATLETWSGTTPTVVTGMDHVQFKQGNWAGSDSAVTFEHPDAGHLWVCELTPAVSGEHTIKITAAVRSTALDTRYFTDISFFPKIDGNSRRQQTSGNKPTPNSSSPAMVGDIDNFNVLFPVDDSFVASNTALGTVMMGVAGNDGLIQEIGMGLPASANAAMVASAHDHSETGAKGKGIEVALGAWCFGPWPNANNYFAGQGCDPPRPKTSTFETCFEYFLWVMVHSLAQTPATPRLKAAILCYNDGSKASQFEAKLIVGHPTNGAQQETITFTATNAGVSRYELLKHPAGNGFRWVSGGQTLVRVQVRDKLNSLNPYSALLGLCLYIDQ